MATTKTTLQNPNYLMPTGFKVIINRKRFSNLEFFANSVSHPTVSLASTTTSFRRADVFQPGDKLNFDELSIDAIMDEKMFVYNEVFDWVTGLVEENQKPQNLRAGLEDTATYDISVLVLDSNNNTIRTVQYKNAFPTTLGTINFTTNAGVEPITCPMTFRYDTFEFT